MNYFSVTSSSDNQQIILHLHQEAMENTTIQISTRTSLEINPKKGSLKFEKESEYGPSKIIEYSTIVWAEATLQFEEWKECFKGETTVKRLVHDDYYFVSSIWARNNVRYSGIHRLNEKGEILPKTGINLDNFEWVNVMKKKEEINVALYGYQGTKGEKRHACVNEIQVWKYKWLLNGVEVDASDDVYSTIQYLTEKEAREVGHVRKPKLSLKTEDQLEIRLSAEYVERPSELLHMRMILHKCVQTGLDIIRYLNCPGCKEDPPAPGQLSHMELGGCLSETDNFLGDEFTGFVMTVIEPEDLIFMYNQSCRKLNVPPTASALLAKAILAWFPVKEVQDTLIEEDELGRENISKNPVISVVNNSLYHLINDVHFNLGMRETLEKRFKAKIYQK